jgi:hypothetical protein
MKMLDKIRSFLTRRRAAMHQQPLRPIAWDKLWRGVLGLLLALLLARFALTLARVPEPVRYISLFALALAALSLVYGLRRTVQWIQTLTIRRALIILLAAYAVAAVTIAFTTTEEVGFSEALPRALVRVPIWLGQEVYRGALALLRFPDEFRFAYTGTRPRLHVAGSDSSADKIAANEPELIEVPALNTSDPALLDHSPGEEVRPGPGADQMCEPDALADDSFLSSGIARVTEGPQYRQARLWWRIRNEAGSGWCPAEVLLNP